MVLIVEPMWFLIVEQMSTFCRVFGMWFVVVTEVNGLKSQTLYTFILECDIRNLFFASFIGVFTGIQSIFDWYIEKIT